MKSMISFFIKYRLWTNVLMFSVFGFGLIMFSQMKYSFFPELEPDFIIVQVAYPGASPEEVEEGVILKIEENLDGLEGVERVTSVSQENFGTVNVEKTESANMDIETAHLRRFGKDKFTPLTQVGLRGCAVGQAGMMAVPRASHPVDQRFGQVRHSDLNVDHVFGRQSRDRR